MSTDAVKPTSSGRKRHNIVWDEPTRARAEKLAELDKRSVSNLLTVLVDKEWERRHSAEQPQPQEKAA